MSIKYLNLTAIVFATLALLLTGCQRETGEIRSSMDPPCEVEAGQSAVFGAILNNISSDEIQWSVTSGDFVPFGSLAIVYTAPVDPQVDKVSINLLTSEKSLDTITCKILAAE